jgi:hypothetical protein
MKIDKEFYCMGIPKPLVQINQLFIVTTVTLGLLFSKVILLIPLLIGIITLVKKQNPIIVFSKRFLKKPLSTYMKEDKEQQLFNQWIATMCLVFAYIGFQLESSLIGYIFGGMVIVAAGAALCGYCIGCTIRYRYIMWKYKRNLS